MALAFFAMTVLLGSSLVAAFILQPTKEDPRGGSTLAPLAGHQRCQRDGLPFIRRSLLRALNLQTEPRLPVGQMAAIRAQWKNTFSTMGRTAKGTAGSASSDLSPGEAPGVGNNTDLKCSQVTSQITLEDLGWDNWVVYPESFTVVCCTPCGPSASPCPALPLATIHGPPMQLQCCEPITKDTLPVVYMDELSSLVISSVVVARACGCGAGTLRPPPPPPPNEE